jgi:CYTH domain-containing protein
LFDKLIDELGNDKLLELETPHEVFTLPDFIPNLVEVTHDPKYKNVYFANKKVEVVHHNV